MRSTYVRAGDHELHVSEWGERGRSALVMWHGLARTGRDFDEAAEALSADYHVICPDTRGRGLSSWADDAAIGYSYSAYGDDALAILDHFGIDRLRWVGTSMGGLLGVTLAAGVLKSRISHLVVNDIGPSIPENAVSRIAAYVGAPPIFDTMGELEAWFRTNYKPFGNNSAAFWRRLSETSARRTDSGKVTVHYDPRIVTQFTLHRADLDCWPDWDAVTAKTMLLRGAESDVLPRAVAEDMARRGPRPLIVEFNGFGHAPTLASDIEIDVLRRFLAT
ncbi:MAG: alpha/beta hydrolase [Phyllobacteriaceae bacterium]|nr:alpha/beta hydrolase [Phyllobacteriaceae bacterium]